MQKTSTYYKIKDILVAASKNKLDIAGLASELYDNTATPSFVYHKRDDNGEVKEAPCGESVTNFINRYSIY